MKPKECFHCKSSNIVVCDGDEAAFVMCGDCGARGPVGETASQAVKAWNKRKEKRIAREPNDVVVVQKVKIHRDVPRACVYMTTLSCGHSVTLTPEEMDYCPRCGRFIYVE